MTPTLPKPKFGEACNGCGLCCIMEVCVAGKIVFGDAAEGPCPALIRQGDKWRCGIILMEKAARLEPITANTLGIGCGCSMTDEDTTQAESEAFDALCKRMVAGELPFQTAR